MDYGPIFGSGAEKLAESAVAPLVALAHGCQTITPDDVKSVIADLGVAPNSNPAMQVRSAVGDRDAMLMRWFSPEDVIEQSKASDYLVRASSFQVRPHPANVRTNERGKKRKYENLVGQLLTFGIHPATPASWLLEPISTLLLAEGAIKADAAMTAYLRHHGATDDELAVTKDMTTLEAIEAMRPLLERIPANERVVIMSIVGVGTWHKNSEWNTLRLDGGEVWVAFDGDVGSNPNVWKQAHDMFSFLRLKKKAKPLLVDLSGQRTATGAKMGADDYLAEGHSWTDLLSHIVDNLPEQPDGVDEGRYRMNPKSCHMEERVDYKTVDGVEMTEWVTKAEMIARVVRIDERRDVTSEEAATGEFAAPASAREVESTAVIEVEWLDGDEVRSSLIEGPATLLATKPERWTDPRLGASISSDVLGLPGWPPTANGFLEAMKSYRRNDTDRNAAWDHMGWVPRDKGGSPAFIVGETVVTNDGIDPNNAKLCGVTDRDLAGASNFGVSLPEDDDQARADIRAMMDHYSKVWTDSRSFAAVLALAMRPCVPLRCNVPALLSGSSGGGKALPLDSMVATPDGWKAMGDLEVGDMLIGPDGRPNRLRGLSPIWTDADIFEVTFDDGQKVRFSGNHVVKVSTNASRTAERRPTGMADHSMLADACVGVAAPIESIAATLGITVPEADDFVARHGIPCDEHGYSLSEVMLATADDDLVPLMANLTVAEMAVRGIDEGFAFPVFGGLDLPEADLPVAPYEVGFAGDDIPDIYQRASIEQRQRVMDGLMVDFDGEELRLPGEHLASDALELLRGLGHKVRRDGDSIRFCDDQRWLHVTDIRKVETVPSRCVHVEHPTGLFVHDGFVVSHNTFTSAAIMAFWQARPGGWSDRQLPGSANDTMAATEIALSKTPIWVSDDHAPSSANPRAQAERTEAINQTIRDVFNGAARRRATQTMGSQKVHVPRALYIVSAESAPLDDQSIMNRLLHIEVAPGFLVVSRDPTDALQDFNRTDVTCARITGRVLLMLAKHIKQQSWPKVVRRWQERLDELTTENQDIIREQRPNSSDSKRQAETVASVTLGIEVFRDLIEELGMMDEYGSVLEQMITDLQSMAIEGFSENKRFELGNRFFADVKMLLRSQQAHIAALGVPGAPCVVGDGGIADSATADAYNQALGWKLTGDPDRPTEARGEVIGWLVHNKTDEPVVLFTDAAFQQVQRKANNRGGLNAKAVWDAVWKAGIPLPEEEGWKRKPRSGNKLDYRVRVMSNGVSAEGVPVRLSDIVDG